MSSESQALIRRLRRLLVTQAAVIAAAAAFYFALNGGEAALAAAWGGGIALSNSALLAWRAWRTERGRALDAQQSMGVLIRTVIERYATVALLFALGLGVLELTPLPLLVGFAVGLLALLGLGKPIHG